MPPPTIYRGARPRGHYGASTLVAIHHAHGPVEPLPKRFDLENHSPTGFEWGYLGSGPAQLALALLADALHNDEEARRLHQQFKSAVVARFAQDSWELTREEIQQWALDQQEVPA